jgi:hypothetical protein
MEKGNILGRMVANMLENINLIKNMVKDNLHGLMEQVYYSLIIEYDG